MSSSELFPTAVSGTVTGDASSASNIMAHCQGNKGRVQIARPQSKIAVIKQQTATKTPRHPATALATTKARNGQLNLPSPKSSNNNSGRSGSNKNNLYTPPLAPSIRATRKQRISQRTYEAINNPSSLPYNTDELKTIIYQLQILQQRHIDSAEYPEAQHVQRVIRAAENKLKNEESRKNSAVDVKDTVVKRHELQAIVDRFVEDWNHHFDYFVNTTTKEATALKQQQQEELDRYDESEPQCLLPKYRKRSTTLIKMRDKERALALNKKFLAAEKMKNKADEAEAEEARLQFRVMQEDFLKKREQLIARHKEQLRVFYTHAEMTRIKMIQQRDQLLEGYLKRMDKIDVNIESLREAGKITENDISNIQLTQFREKAVTESEYSYPIPRIRPGTSFMNARNGLVTIRPEQKKQKTKQIKQQTENLNYSQSEASSSQSMNEGSIPEDHSYDDADNVVFE